jgi:hypothetical protein
VAVVAALAFSPVASGQDPGAVTSECPSVGQIVITPSGNNNENCTAPGPKRGGGTHSVPCSETFGPGWSGNIVFVTNGQYKEHCSPPEETP